MTIWPISIVTLWRIVDMYSLLNKSVGDLDLKIYKSIIVLLLSHEMS